MAEIDVSRKSSRVRANLSHPVIDSDGHLQEFTNLLRADILDEALELGGPALAKRVEGQPTLTIDEFMRYDWNLMTDEERRDRWIACPAWWAQPTSTVDRATSYLPALLYERLDEIGLDYSVLYPSMGLTLGSIEDEDVRRLACRVYNRTYAELYRPYADRLAPVAMIPTVNPQEAVEELDHAVRTLGYKAIALHHVRRPIPAVERVAPAVSGFARRLETYGIDSEHDYDPFWSRCLELGVPVGFHASEQSWGSRRSPSRYAYNHIGAFAQAAESICKSIFMGGVTRRFPGLNFAFLEGGVGWACMMFADMVSHWEKRGRDGIRKLDPANLDVERFMALVDEYGSETMRANRGRVDQFMRRPEHRPADLDDWRECGIESLDDFRTLFVEPFYFGCEADDPINAWAVHAEMNPIGATLRTLFSSDIGHWDVSDMAHVVDEAYELVERSLYTPAQFEAFVFSNPVEFYCRSNPTFFDGTRVESAAAAYLATRSTE
jgi:predicted TIM-barrel fold metal-dependent hydrolase